MFKSVKGWKVHQIRVKCGRVVKATKRSVQTDKSSVNEDLDLSHSALLVDVAKDRGKIKWPSSQNRIGKVWRRT